MTSPEVFSEPTPPRKVRQSTSPTFLSGGGEMGERMRAMDWSATPLGPVSEWPQSLRSCVSMMLPSSAQIILFWGPEFVSLYNDAYIPVFGAKHPKMLGQPGRVAWSEIWENQLRGLLEGVVQSGNSFHGKDLEFLLERNGFVEETYFDVSYDPVRIESGEVGGVYCIVTDTTGRVVGERRLALLKDLAAKTTTARSARQACTLAMEVLTGRKPTPFALAYLDGKLVASTPGAEDQLLESQSEHVRELPIPGGRLVLGLSQRRPYDEQYASFVDLVAGQISSAITGAQAYEEERQRAESLAELDRAKTAFFSNVSHEFRTPLTLMLGPVTELLANTDRSHADRNSLELVERNAVRLQKLVNTLLDFSRLEAGRVQARYTRVDLGGLTADLASTFRSTIERSGVKLRVECESPMTPAYVDREMWEKVVLNLLSNAYKHTFAGEILVRLQCEGNLAKLSVTDTGVGIPAADVDKVFDRFHRVASTRSRTHEGSGIGLSLVRELTRLHGGTVGVTSIEGQGSTFTVTIPLGSTHLPPDQIETQPAAAESISAPFVREALSWSAETTEQAMEPALPSDTAALAGAEILIADDNADMRNYIARLLRDAGARVQFAADGHAALQRMREHAPDLVVCDVMMPRLDGFGVLTEMRADDNLKTIPFVMLSARAGEESRVGGLAAGADDYLVKPFVAKELIARVASQLRLARASAAERSARADADEARREMSRVFEQAPIPICVVEGKDLLYTSANAHYRQIIGNRDPVGKTLLQLWPNLDGSAIHNVFLKVLETGKAISAEEFLVTFDQFGRGEPRDAYFNFVYHPLTDTAGKTRGIIAIAVDVTPQVLARREAERLKTAAEAANEAKVQFLRTVSHETRQPVHASLGYIDLLMLGIRGELNEGQKSDIENIRRNQAHLLRLLNDILSFAKLEAGALELEVESSDAAEIITVLEPLVEPQFRAKGVAYKASKPSVPAKFKGDRERTVQVCINLLTNALKATPPGGTVTIACEVQADSVSLKVSDTGIGIPENKLEEIFDPFTQLARAKASRSEVSGFGLGLSISRQLARAMKGDVTVESTVGAGSKFTFTLPRA